jgi:hypothetical protein
MNYQEERLDGVFSTLFSLGQAGYEYGTAYYDARRQDAELTLVNAQNTATAREAGIEAKYAASRAAIQSELDVEKQKRYLIIGAAIGIPLLFSLILLKKGR